MFKYASNLIRKNFINIHKYFFTGKITDELVFKKVETGSSTDLVNLSEQEKYLADSSKFYYDLLEEHYEMKIPFLDEEYYKRLFEITKQIVNNENLDSWNILERFVILNIETIDLPFLTDISLNFSQIRLSNFELWYYIEKRVIKNIKDLSNKELALFIYTFGYNSKGSNYLFSIFSNEVLDRKIRNFKHEEFKYIYHGFKFNKIQDKLLWAILDKANIELNYNL